MCPYFSDPPPPRPRLLTKEEVCNKIQAKLTAPAMTRQITIEDLPDLLGDKETKSANVIGLDSCNL
jgi:hypothetical protein